MSFPSTKTPPDAALSSLRDRYMDEAGKAYAASNDKRATALRALANLIETLRVQLETSNYKLNDEAQPVFRTPRGGQ